MAENEVTPAQTAGANQATPIPQTTEPAATENPAVSAIAGAGQAADQAKQTISQAGDQAQQAMAQAQQAAAQAQQSAQQVAAQAQQLAGQAQQVGSQAQNLVKDLLMPKPNQPKVGMDEKIYAFIGYIPLVAVITLILKPNSKYVLLHGRQGLLMTLILFISLIFAILPSIGPLLSALIVFALFIVGVYSAYQALIGNWWKIPVLGDIAELIPVAFFAAATREAITGQPAEVQPQMPETVQPSEVQQPAAPAPSQPVETNTNTESTNPPVANA